LWWIRLTAIGDAVACIPKWLL